MRVKPTVRIHVNYSHFVCVTFSHTCLQLCKVSNTIWNLTNLPHVCDTSKTRKQHSAKSPYTRFMKYVTWCIRLGCVMGADPLLSRDQIKSPLTKMPLNMNKCQPLFDNKSQLWFSFKPLWCVFRPISEICHAPVWHISSFLTVSI